MSHSRRKTSCHQSGPASCALGLERAGCERAPAPSAPEISSLVPPQASATAAPLPERKSNEATTPPKKRGCFVSGARKKSGSPSSTPETSALVAPRASTATEALSERCRSNETTESFCLDEEIQGAQRTAGALSVTTLRLVFGAAVADAQAARQSGSFGHEATRPHRWWRGWTR